MIRPSPRLAARRADLLPRPRRLRRGRRRRLETRPRRLVKSLRVLDYYSNEPDKTGSGRRLLDACGQQAGVTIQREAVPGRHADPEGAAAGLVQDPAGRADARQPRSAADRGDRRARPARATSACPPTATRRAWSTPRPTRASSTACSRSRTRSRCSTTRTSSPRPASTPPTTWEELRTAAKKLTSGKQYGMAFSAPANYEGTWQFLPFMWSNGGDEKDIATPETAQARCSCGSTWSSDGSASKSVVNWAQADVNDQFKAGNAAMMVNGPWQFPVLNADEALHYKVVPIPAPRPGASRRRAARRRDVDRAADRQQGAPGEGGQDRRSASTRTRTSCARRGAADRPHQDGAAGQVRRGATRR